MPVSGEPGAWFRGTRWKNQVLSGCQPLLDHWSELRQIVNGRAGTEVLVPCLPKCSSLVFV